MHKKDKIKLWMFLAIVVLIVTSYLIGGKSSILLKSATIIGLVAWLSTMIYVKRKM